MPRVLDVKCPRCGAPLPIPPGLDTVACRYCGARSLIDRGRGPHTAAPHTGMPVVRVAPPSPALAVVITAIAGVVTIAGAGIALFLGSARGSGGSSGSPSQGASPLLGVTTPRFYFSDQPMLADVNGDGVPDVVGKSSIPGGEEWIAAYDGRDGKEIWRTATLTKDAANYDARRAVVGDRVISIDALGKAQAYDLRTGMPSWSSLLGEKAKRVCQGEGVIVVQTADDARHGLDPATGKQREIAKDAPCKPVPSSHKEEAPGYQIIGWSEFDRFGLPALHDIDGISAHRALIPSGPGPRFMLGSRAKGTPVAMVAAVDKKKVLWKDVVPGVEPLTTSVNVTTQEAAFIGGFLVIPYNMKDHDAGTRMACFDGASGKRLWDVQIHKKSQVSAGLAVSANDVFFASWTALYVHSLKTGQPRFMLGTGF